MTKPKKHQPSESPNKPELAPTQEVLPLGSDETAKVLLNDLRELIEASRRRVATAFNAETTVLYWSVGQRIRKDILGMERAEYGEKILPTLSAELVPDYGRGFSERNLYRMIQFAEVFSDGQIVATLSR